MHHDPTPELQMCIDQCTNCHDVCLRDATTHCLELGGDHSRPEHLKLMFDCAEICRVAANFMLRGSHRHLALCTLCAEICSTCAEDCERVGDMPECVEACRACAESCREMSQLESR